MNELVLKDFRGVPEITPSAYQLREEALEAAKPIARVETSEQQQTAVEALRKIKEIRTGVENTRKAIKSPVLELGRKIDALAHEFMAEVEKQYGRLSGLINHYQRKQLETRAEEERKIQQGTNEAAELRAKAAKLRESKSKVNMAMADALEQRAFDLEMNAEVALVPATDKPKGLVVRNKINFQVIDAIVFCQAWPKYWKWHADTETLKLDRMRILDELNKENGNGDFHKTRFPEELSQTDDRRLVQPAGLRVYEETKAHVR